MAITQLQKSKAQYSIKYRIDGLNDPTAVATDGVTGTEYLKTSAPPGLFLKLDDGVSTNWLNISSGGGQVISGSLDAPFLLNNGDQIMLASNFDHIIFVAGNGAPVVAGVPIIVTPTAVVGEKLTIYGCSVPNTVEVDPNADWITNGNRVLGIDPVTGIIGSLIMQCVRAASIAHPNGTWTQIGATP